MYIQPKVGGELPIHSSTKSGYKPVHTHGRIPPPLFPIHLYFSLTSEQVSSLEDCLFYTASEVHPEAFRKKALALIAFIRQNARYGEMIFESEKYGGDCDEC